MDLLLRCPSCCTELTVTDRLGFDVIQTVPLREECQTTNDNECHCRDSNERPCLFVQVVHLISHGFEYALAGLMISEGMLAEGLTVVRAVRDRYQGHNRNPWNEIECGSNYARSMASFALLPILSGFCFDLPAGRIGFDPVVDQNDFSCFWSAGAAWGQVRIETTETVITVLGGGMTLSSLKLPYLKSVRCVCIDGKEIPWKYENGILYFEQTTIKKEIVIR